MLLLLPLPPPLPPELVWKPVSASTTTVSVAAIFTRVRTIAVSPLPSRRVRATPYRRPGRRVASPRHRA
ncbi:hypothetical protein GCM10017562_32720 [Streptomyces roseofulvus]